MHKPDGVFEGAIRLIEVIKGFELHGPTMNAGPVVGLMEGRLDTKAHTEAQLLCRAAEGGGLPEDHPVRVDSVDNSSADWLIGYRGSIAC